MSVRSPQSSDALTPARDIASSYNGSNATYRLLLAFNWGPVLLNLGYFSFRGPLGFLNWFRDLSVAQLALAGRSIGLLGVADGHHVLDIACGRGKSSFLIRNQSIDAKVVGIDLLPNNVNVARSLFGHADGLHYQVGDATQLDFEDASFDRVLCLEAAFHFPDRAAFLRECRRVLRPGGKLVVVDIVWQSDEHRTVVDTPEIRLLREVWQWSDLNSISDYRRQAAAAGLRVTAEHDWTRNVSEPLLKLFDNLVWLGRRSWGRNLLRWYNPPIANFSDDDWRHIEASAAAHRTMHSASRYVAFELVADGAA